MDFKRIGELRREEVEEWRRKNSILICFSPSGKS
jgi:hypothetical protein